MAISAELGENLEKVVNDLVDQLRSSSQVDHGDRGGMLGLVHHPRRYARIPEIERQSQRRRPIGNDAIISIARADMQFVRVLHAVMDLIVPLGD